MTIVEKMARAILAERYGKEAALMFDGVPAPARKLFQKMIAETKAEVLAALKALREPDEGMVQAMHREGGQSMRAIWAAMIDHAIQEHEA